MNNSEQQTPSPSRVDPLLIFVVDDESAIGEVVSIILRRSGYRPRFFQDPDRALKAIISEELKPALLLTDYIMGPMTGMELIERSKQHHPELRTLLYSGNASETMLQQYPIEPDGFLQKPFLPAALVDLVRFILERSLAPAQPQMQTQAGV
jgi:DNA-binding NtrC family response regulator